MISSILVGTDGSPQANVACDYAFRIANAFRAPLTGIHVIDARMIEGPMLADISGSIGASGYFSAYAPFQNLLRDKANAIESAFRENAALHGVPVEFIQEIGHPFHVLHERQEKHDLIVLGRRGESESLSGDLIGSITDRMVRKAVKPCLITPAKTLPMSRILVACDNSPIADRVLQTATEFAVRFDIPIVLLTATEQMDGKEGRQTLQKACALAERCGKIAEKTILSEGDAADAILASASDENCNLIIMGAHGHSRVREWFVGCTSMRVLADSALPILLVR